MPGKHEIVIKRDIELTGPTGDEFKLGETFGF